MSRVCNAVATGDLTQKITVPVQGDLMVQLKKVRGSFIFFNTRKMNANSHAGHQHHGRQPRPLCHRGHPRQPRCRDRGVCRVLPSFISCLYSIPASPYTILSLSPPHTSSTLFFFLPRTYILPPFSFPFRGLPCFVWPQNSLRNGIINANLTPPARRASSARRRTSRTSRARGAS